MGKKNKGGNGENKNNINNGSGGGGGGGESKTDDSIMTVVLKLDMHCEGCATKIKKSIKSFQGVKMVKGGDRDLTKLTVVGKFDPTKLREAVENAAKKKVDLVQSAVLSEKDTSNKENNNGINSNGGDGGGGGGGGGREINNKQGEKKGVKKAKEEEKKKNNNNKAKEPPATTAVMKLDFHCHGCIQKIRKIVTKTKGYIHMSIDEGRGQMTVKGTMDMKALALSLAEKLRTSVDVVPPKKEAEKKEKENENISNGGEGKSGGNVDNANGGGQNMIQYAECVYPNPAVFGYGYGYPVEHLLASQMFSDENPNACSVM